MSTWRKFDGFICVACLLFVTSQVDVSAGNDFSNFVSLQFRLRLSHYFLYLSQLFYLLYAVYIHIFNETLPFTLAIMFWSLIVGSDSILNRNSNQKVARHDIRNPTTTTTGAYTYNELYSLFYETDISVVVVVVTLSIYQLAVWDLLRIYSVVHSSEIWTLGFGRWEKGKRHRQRGTGTSVSLSRQLADGLWAWCTAPRYFQHSEWRGGHNYIQLVDL